MKKLSKYLHPAIISKIGAYSIDPKGIVEGNIAGAHKSPFHGFSVEFAGHREYMPGDDPKHIDWNVYYKRDKYFIKQYEAETNMIAQIFLDASESMNFKSGELSKLDYAAYLAVTLTYLITNARDSMGMAIFNEKIVEYLPPSNSLQTVYKMSDILQKMTPVKKTVMSNTMIDFAERIGRRELVIIISDCLLRPDELHDGLSRLRYDQHEVVLFHIMDPQEVNFDLEGTIRFKGMEDSGDLKMDARRVRQSYLKEFAAHRQKIHEVCEKNQTEYVAANTAVPVSELLMAYLNSRLTHINR